MTWSRRRRVGVPGRNQERRRERPGALVYPLQHPIPLGLGRGAAPRRPPGPWCRLRPYGTVNGRSGPLVRESWWMVEAATADAVDSTRSEWAASGRASRGHRTAAENEALF